MISTFGTCNFGVGDQFSVVIVDHDAVSVFDEAKVFGALQNEAD